MKSIETLHTEQGALAALIIRSKAAVDGIEFFTPSEQSQQVGLMTRPRGYIVEAHEHNPQRREIWDTNEVLVVRTGTLRITLFDESRRHYRTFDLEAGDVVLLGAGGHMIEFLEDSQVMEVKQGPYSEIADKLRFEPDWDVPS